MKKWHVYIVRCADGTLYTGIAKDVAKRVADHNTSERRAARYTRARRPVVLVYREAFETRSEATRREIRIKGMGKRQKEALVRSEARAFAENNITLSP